MSISFKWLIVGLALSGIILWALRPKDSTPEPTPVFKAFNQDQVNHSGGKQIITIIGTNTGGDNQVALYAPPVSVTNLFNMRGTNEIGMIQLMTATLATLGIEKDERTVKQLVLARVKADWSKFPAHFKTDPGWAAFEAHTLKGKISRLLNTTNALTLQRVLECSLGPEIPPMADFEVRDGNDAIKREAMAMKQ